MKTRTMTPLLLATAFCGLSTIAFNNAFAFDARKLTVTEGAPQGSVYGNATQAFLDEITRRTDGAITFQVFFSSSLLTAAESAAGIASGTADLGIVTTPYTPADFPVANWQAGLGSELTGGVPYAIMVGSLAQTEFGRHNPALAKEFGDQGLQLIGSYSTQAFDLLCNKPVKNLADAKGKRTRVGGQTWGREVEAMGMVAVPLVPAEVYEAFSRGIIDCLAIHPNVYLDFGVMDVPGTKYYLPIEMSGWLPTFMTINAEVWRSLTPELQTIFNDSFAAYITEIVRGSLARHAQFAEKTASSSVTLLTPDADIMEALRGFQQQSLAEMLTTAPASIADPAGFMAEFRSDLDDARSFISALGYAPAPNDPEVRMAGYKAGIDLDPLVKGIHQSFADQ